MFDLLRTYLAFTYHAQNEDGTMRNFMSYQRYFLDTVATDDVLGRTLWACAYVSCADGLPNNVKEVARIVFEKAARHATRALSLRGMAYCILGLCYAKDVYNDAAEKIETLSAEILRSYERNKGPRWEWFEDFMSYSNARLPQAMFLAYEAIGDARLLACGEKTLKFLWSEVVTSKGAVNVVGNRDWYVRGKHRALTDEQAIDVGALVEALLDAWRITRKRHYYEDATACFGWFAGNNLLRSPMYDEVTAGCFDGLSLDKGINQNLGAESTLAYLLCRLAFEEVPRPE